MVTAYMRAAGGAGKLRLGACRQRPAGTGWLAAFDDRGNSVDCTAAAGRKHVHIVIMGCGRVGSTLAHILEDQDHSVAVIDQDAEAFRKLRSGFKGTQGDRRRVRPGRADRGRNRAGRRVRRRQQRRQLQRHRGPGGQGVVRRAAGRGPDLRPRRAEVYQRLGIPTVATVAWTADQMLRRLLPEGARALWRDPTGAVVLAEVACCDDWLGQKVCDLELAARARIALHLPARRGADARPRHRSAGGRRAARDRQPKSQIAGRLRSVLAGPAAREGVATDARRHRGCRRGRPVDRQGAARERARGPAH